MPKTPYKRTLNHHLAINTKDPIPLPDIEQLGDVFLSPINIHQCFYNPVRGCRQRGQVLKGCVGSACITDLRWQQQAPASPAECSQPIMHRQHVLGRDSEHRRGFGAFCDCCPSMLLEQRDLLGQSRAKHPKSCWYEVNEHGMDLKHLAAKRAWLVRSSDKTRSRAQPLPAGEHTACLRQERCLPTP